MSHTITSIQTSEYILSSAGNPLSITRTGGVETSTGTAIYGGAVQAWTITNAGTISAGSVNTSVGIDLEAGGTIRNFDLISGIEYAVRIAGAAGLVTNTDSITGNLDGVVMWAGGSVSNAAAGVITGGFNVGVYITGGAATVTNAGTIIGAGSAYAVQLSGGFNDRVIVDPGAVFSGKVDGGNAIGATTVSTLELAAKTATGTLTGIGTEYVDFAQIVVDPGASWEVTGNNTIGTGATLTNAGTLLGQYGLSLTGGTIINAGTIDGEAPKSNGLYINSSVLTNQSGGTIEGGYDGVRDTTGTVTNYGLISGAGALADGVVMFGAGAVVNEATASILGPNFIGIETYGVGDSITNAGLVSGLYGILLQRSGMITNVAGGTITGQGFGIQGAALTTVVNAGTISGTGTNAASVELTAGYANRVVVDPGAVFSGTVDGGNTIGATIVSTLELAAGTATGTLTALGAHYIDFSQVTVDPGASWVFTGGAEVGTGVTLTADRATLSANGTPLIDNGTIQLGSGTLTVGNLVGTGGVTIGAGGTLASQGQIQKGLTVDFTGSSGVLSLTQPKSDRGTLSGFRTGDTIGLVGVDNVTGVELAHGDTLQINLSGGAAPISLLVSGDYTGDVFNHTLSGSDTLITVVACFARGTRIRTDRGEAPVENLAIGDRVMTLSGEAQPVKWIGRRGYAGRFLAGDRNVLPIRIEAGALEDGVPARDLWVSPEHALYLDGVLVPARQLVNEASIVQATAVESIEYFHIELAAHEVIFAEGAAAETFIDDDSRMMFHNALEFLRLYPEARPAPALYCAPRIEDGYELEDLRRRLLARARRLRTDGVTALSRRLPVRRPALPLRPTANRHRGRSWWIAPLPHHPACGSAPGGSRG